MVIGLFMLQTCRCEDMYVCMTVGFIRCWLDNNDDSSMIQAPAASWKNLNRLHATWKWYMLSFWKSGKLLVVANNIIIILYSFFTVAPNTWLCQLLEEGHARWHLELNAIQCIWFPMLLDRWLLILHVCMHGCWFYSDADSINDDDSSLIQAAAPALCILEELKLSTTCKWYSGSLESC